MAKLTPLGSAAISNAAVSGVKVNFLKIKIGDGGGAVPNFNGSETALVNQVTEVDVTAVYRRTTNPNYIYIEGIIPFSDGGYTIREACAVDAGGNVLVIGEYAPIDKPSDTDPNAREVLIRIVATIESGIEQIRLFSFSGSSGSVVSGGEPVGTVVTNYLAGNDPGSPAWVKLAANVSADVRIYPKLIGLNSPGALTFSSMSNTSGALLQGLAGTWSICSWNVLNGKHLIVLRNMSGAGTAYKTFVASDGVNYVAGGDATAAAAITSTVANTYYLNGKYFIVSQFGVFESTDGCVTWVRKTSNSYCSMAYFNGLYIFGGFSDTISTSVDLVTFTQVYAGGTGGEITNFQLFAGKLFAFKNVLNTKFQIRHTQDGSAWTGLTINTYTHTNNIGYCQGLVHKNKLVILMNDYQFAFASDDGLNGWAQLPAIQTTGCYFGRGAIVAADTIYGRNYYSTDLSANPRVMAGPLYGLAGEPGGFAMDGANVYYGKVTNGGSYPTLAVYKFPVTENEHKVYLPNIANAMMKVQ